MLLYLFNSTNKGTITVDDFNPEILNMMFDLAVDHDSNFGANLSAAVVKRNKIISFGFNTKKSHPFQARFGKNGDSIFWHAETNAIYNALKKVGRRGIENGTLYVARAKYDRPGGQLVHGMACPCEGCMEAIEHYKIKKVYFTVNSGTVGNLDFESLQKV